MHRDVNPPNVLVSRFGDVKLSDFGIARGAARAQLTMAGSVRGKLGYMAPEQAMGHPFDGRADLFALGLTLYEVLTGRRALQAPTDEALLRASVDALLEPPSRFNPAVPPALDAIVMGLLEKDPALRTATGAQLRGQLLALQGAAAPFPQGQALLAQVARDALEQARLAAVAQEEATNMPPSRRLTARA